MGSKHICIFSHCADRTEYARIAALIFVFTIDSIADGGG